MNFSRITKGLSLIGSVLTGLYLMSTGQVEVGVGVITAALSSASVFSPAK